MPIIIGNIKPEDDYTHPLGSEQNFNESVYFNFFDRAQNRGGFVRLGNRANEGYAEMTVIVYNADGSAFFNYKRPEILNNDEWNAGGLKVEVLVAGEKLRTTYDGVAVYLKDPRAMSDPGKAFSENPIRHLKLDLVHHGVGPIYGHVGQSGDSNEFARAHYEQHMCVGGTLQFDDEQPIQFDGHGLRDHSWGPRYWQSVPSYRWITANYGDNLGMVISVIGGKPNGVLYDGDALYKIDAVDLQTDYEEGTKFHKALRAMITLSDGETHDVVGTVKGFIPLRNRRGGATTYIGEGMTEYVLDGKHIGYGLSEYLDQPE